MKTVAVFVTLTEAEFDRVLALPTPSECMAEAWRCASPNGTKKLAQILSEPGAEMHYRALGIVPDGNIEDVRRMVVMEGAV